MLDQWISVISGNTYGILKLTHILSATFLWGTGVGTVFYMVFAHIGGNPITIRDTTRHVVLADWIFTAPTFLLIQPLTGYLLMQQMGIPIHSPWFLQVSVLYGIVALFWFPVVKIQMHLRDLTAHLQVGNTLPQAYRRWFWVWLSCGVPAAVCMMILFMLMVFKPGIGGY
ncbi:predicted integral membrane protein [gamma proteobacterium HdN1]|nr:predicted integral membrane protein [gamma proteobacterium HdN1]